jgi:hypothetical protein
MYNVSLATIQKNLYLVEYQLNDLSFIEDFKTLIDNNVSNLSYKTNVKGKMTEWSLFCDNEVFINIIKSCSEIISFIEKRGLVCNSAWGNILEGDNEVLMHSHSESAVSGIIYLTENGPGTYFPQFNKIIEEKIGKIVFFSPEAMHGVTKSKLNKKRVTNSHSFKINQLNIFLFSCVHYFFYCRNYFGRVR